MNFVGMRRALLAGVVATAAMREWRTLSHHSCSVTPWTLLKCSQDARVGAGLKGY